MNLLDNLWKSAADLANPEMLIGKQCRNRYGTPCLISVRQDGVYVCFRDTIYMKADLSGIEYLDDSKEAVDFWVRPKIKEIIADIGTIAYQDGKDHAICSSIDFDTYINLKFNQWKIKEQDNHKQQDNG